MGYIPSRGGTTGGGSGGGGSSYASSKGTVSYPAGTSEVTVYEYLNTSGNKIRLVCELNPFAVFTPGRLLTVRTYCGVNGSYGSPHDKVQYTVGSDEIAPVVEVLCQEKVKVTVQLDITESGSKSLPYSLFIVGV